MTSTFLPVPEGNRYAANPSTPVFFSGMIAALSFAIDLTEGAVSGHALRTCILGMRLAETIGMRPGELAALYPALVLKDVGCSSNAARMCEIVGGDDRRVKNNLKLQNWKRPRQALGLLWRETLPNRWFARRAARVLRIGMRRQRNSAEMIALRCERGAQITRKLGLSEATSAAIHSLDERWDGTGHPAQLSGAGIPLAARVIAVAQHLDVFASEHGPDEAVRTLAERAGTAMDPWLVQVAAAMASAGSLFTGCLWSDELEGVRDLALSLEPAFPVNVQAEEIDRICEAFADVVDAKSPFTYRHSQGVAETALAIAQTLQLPAARRKLVWRAALLHDLGKLGVPNTILDKAGTLNAAEWAMVSEHPRLTREIIRRIPGFTELAEVAGAHHERLDGSGYPQRLTAAGLGIEARIVAVADSYQAITEERPYRAGASHMEAMRRLRGLAPDQLDAECVEALDRSLRPVSGRAVSGRQ